MHGLGERQAAPAAPGESPPVAVRASPGQAFLLGTPTGHPVQGDCVDPFPQPSPRQGEGWVRGPPSLQGARSQAARAAPHPPLRTSAAASRRGGARSAMRPIPRHHLERPALRGRPTSHDGSAASPIALVAPRFRAWLLLAPGPNPLQATPATFHQGRLATGESAPAETSRSRLPAGPGRRLSSQPAQFPARRRRPCDQPRARR